MAKDNKKGNAPETPANAQTPATGETGEQGKDAKAKSGSSASARARKLVVNLFTQISASLAERFENTNLTDLMDATTAKEFTELSEEISSSATKGLPLATQLANAQAERNAIYARAKAVDGVMKWASDADEDKVDTLGAKIKRLRTAIANANNKTSEVADTAKA